MKQNNLGRFILVIVIVLWALWEVYPPTSRDLIQAFKSRAQHQDATFAMIMTNVTALQKAGTNSEYAVLQEAIGTNNIEPYFPAINAKTQLHPTQFILNRVQRESLGRIKLGLDLQGGTSFLLEMDTNVLASSQTNSVQRPEDAASQALNQAKDVINRRIDRFGVAEPLIQSAGANRILVQLPGLSQADKESATEQMKKKAYLEFRLVKEDSEAIIQNNEPAPPGYVLMIETSVDPKTGQQVKRPYIVKKKAEPGLSGDIIKRAYVNRDNLGNPEIEFELTDAGAKSFGDTTRENVGRQLAIVLDDQLYSAPNINGPIEAGSGQITGRYSLEEAQELANVLQNPLRAPLNIVSSYDVDPTLGKDSIESGIRASVYGIIFVSAFMLIYYRLSGLAANVALVTNIIILLGVMCSIGTTLTLPGIAGVVLTVGMAVDANVLIYERIREELAKGKSLRGAIDAGYARAFGTIFDSHVTTLISSIILIVMGTGEIKGFGVTLTIGVAASLFTALIVTRLIFNFMLDRNMIKTLSMAHIIKSAKVDFMSIAKVLFFATWIFVILSIGFGFTRGHKLFGIDFLGGDSTTYSYAVGKKMDVDQIRKVMDSLGEKDSQIQYQKAVGSSDEALRITSSSGTAAKVTSALQTQFPQAQFKVIGQQNVGAVVGSEILQTAVTASLLALLGILFYVAVRYEFSFAVAAVVAVLHDVLFTIGAYCISNAFQERQFNATVVAAILTIIGFSINDKIVIFDRIREDLKLGMRGTFREIINQALNQTLSRTIITSGTVFLATGSLYLFGGGVINDFAFTFLVGIVVGTYSSIYIASVLVLWWHKGERPNIGAPVSAQSTASAKV